MIVRGRGIDIQAKVFKPKKQFRSDKKLRVNVTMDKNVHDKLVKVSKVCDLSKTTLALRMIEFCLLNGDILDYIQDEYRVHRADRIIPVYFNGEIDY